MRYNMKDVIKFIEEEEEHKVIAIKPYSAHPADYYSWMVLCEVDETYSTRDKYVTWLYNMIGNPGGSWGHYFDNLEEALEDFGKRMHKMF